MKLVLPQSVDANASGPVLPQAWEAYRCATAEYADPDAAHTAGRAARALLEQARAQVAGFLHADPDEIIFTSGGTEADAWALVGVLTYDDAADVNARPHCVCSSIEHAAVKRTLEKLQRRGHIDVTWVDVDRSGQIAVQAMQAALRPQTRLVSILAASNETGVLQPVPEVAALARAHGALVHTDAVQAIGRIPVDVRGWGVDLLALAGHKVGAVGGIGALYVRRGVDLGYAHPVAASLNVAGAASLAAALAHQPSAEQLASLAAMRDQFEASVLAALPDTEVMGGNVPRLANTSCLRLGGCEADGVLMALDLQGFAVSTGSACSSGSIEPSPILLGMGLSAQEARQTLRFSFPVGARIDVAGLVARLVDVVRRMRKAT